MTNSEKKCREVQQTIFEQAAGVRLSPAHQQHVATCSECRGLVECLNGPEHPPSPSIDVMNRAAELMKAGLRPVRPLASRSTYTIVLSAILVCAFGVAASSMSPYGWEEMGGGETVLVLLALALGAAVCVRSLLKQMTPAGLYEVKPELLPPLVIGALAIGSAILFRFEREEKLWSGAWVCLRIGLSIALPTVALVWLVIRRGFFLSPAVTGTTAGVVAGLIGTGALEVHCPNLAASHILVSHLGVAVCTGILGLVIGRATAIRSS